MERDRLQVKHFKGWQIPPITWHFNYLTAWGSRMIHLWVWAPQGRCAHTCVPGCESRQSWPAVLWPWGLQPARLLCPWHSPGKNTGEGCHILLQGIFPIQGRNPRLMSPAPGGWSSPLAPLERSYILITLSSIHFLAVYFLINFSYYNYLLLLFSREKMEK